MTAERRVESRGNRRIPSTSSYNDCLARFAVFIPPPPPPRPPPHPVHFTDTRALFVARSAYAILRRSRPPLGQEVTGARSRSELNCTSERLDLLERTRKRGRESRTRTRTRERERERAPLLSCHFLTLHPQRDTAEDRFISPHRAAENGYKLNEGTERGARRREERKRARPTSREEIMQSRMLTSRSFGRVKVRGILLSKTPLFSLSVLMHICAWN